MNTFMYFKKLFMTFIFVCLIISNVSYAFENKISSTIDDNSIVDTRTTRNIKFHVDNHNSPIYYKGFKYRLTGNDFFLNISKLSGKQNIVFKNDNDEEFIFTYYFADKDGYIDDYELVSGKDLNCYLTTYDDIQIIYTDTELNTVSILKDYLGQIPTNMYKNLHTIKMVPYSNTLNIAGSTKDGRITLYNFTKYDTKTQQNIIFHEVSHVWANDLIEKGLIDESFSNYNNVISKDNNFISKYAADFANTHDGKLSEDFADSMAFYLINKETFASTYPNRTEYLKELINNSV